MPARSHGRTASKEYWAWDNMRSRCNNPNFPQYQDYGGRGISYDPRWNSFEAFLADMGEAPNADMTLDRMKNNLGYSKDNCRWATHSEQQYNQRIRKDNTSGVKGVGWQADKQRWRAYYGRSAKLLYAGPSLEAAIQARKDWEAANLN